MKDLSKKILALFMVFSIVFGSPLTMIAVAENINSDISTDSVTDSSENTSGDNAEIVVSTDKAVEEIIENDVLVEGISFDKKEGSENISEDEIEDVDTKESAANTSDTSDVFNDIIEVISVNIKNAIASVPEILSATPVAPAEINSVRFSTINSSYKGIVIDSYFENFSDTDKIIFTINRADGSTVVRESGPDTLAHINAGGKKALTTPFNFANSLVGGWYGALNAVWTKDTKPVSVKIEAFKNGSVIASAQTPIDQGLVEKNGKYEDLIPTYLPSTTLVVHKNANNLVGATFKVSGDVESLAVPLNRVYVQLVNRQDNTRYGGTTLNLIGKGNKASWEVVYDANKLNLPEGKYAAHVEVTAMDGSRGSNGWTENFTLDKTNPSFEFITPTNGSTVKGAQRMSVKITDVNDIQKILFNVGDGKGNYTWEKGKNGKVTRDGDLFYMDIDTKTLEDGVNHIVLRATDGAGNTRYWNNKKDLYSFNVDNTSPTAKIVAPDFTNKDIEIKGEAYDASGIKSHWFEVKNPLGDLFYKNFPNTNIENVSFGLGSIVGGIVEGVYKIRYVVTDLVGNRNDDPNYSNSETHDLVIDKTKPTVELISPINSGPFNDKVSIEVSSTDENGLDVIVANIYSNTNVLVKSTQTKIKGEKIGSHKVEIELIEGEYYIKYNSKDLAGNISITNSFSFVINKTTSNNQDIDESAETTPVVSSSNVIGGRSSGSVAGTLDSDGGEVLGATTFNFTTFMKIGSREGEVPELQKFLNEKGYGPLVIDSVFGSFTRAAVIRFQIANGLVGDGIVGPLTRAALNK